MWAIPIVGKCFPSAAQSLAYLDGLKWGIWRPRSMMAWHLPAQVMSERGSSSALRETAPLS